MLLSIITATYKREKFLKKNYIFLRSQKKKFKFEWVVVFETKDNKTKKFLKNIKDSFVKKIETNSGNADKAYNIGFKHAKGKYLNIHGDDDFFEKKYFYKIEQILKSDENWIIGQGDYINQSSKKIRLITTYIKKFLIKNYNPKILNLINFAMTPSIFFKRNLIKKVGGYNDKIKYGADYIFWLNFNKLFKPLIINDVITNITYNKQTKTGKFELSTYKVFLNELKKFSKNNIFRLIQYLVIYFIILINFISKKILRVY